MKRFHLIANLLVLLALGLAACAPNGAAAPTVEHDSRPGAPVYSQLIWDCNTGQSLPVDYSTSGPIQPGSGCDSWQLNRYERPFNPDSQDTFYPDLDILSGELGSDGNWFYFRLSVFDEDPDDEKLTGSYAIEIDLDMDGRGDVLVVATAPTEEAEQDWSVAGVQFWGDGNNDVGNQIPMAPDPPYDGNGYDTLVFNHGEGDDPDLAWVRVHPGKPAVVEIAFKASAILFDPHFKWWAWTDQGVNNPAGADYHDSFDHPEAGDAIVGQTYFPSNAINELDNTCSSIWGAPPSADPDLCSNDPSVPPPTLEPTTTPNFDLTPTQPDYTATPTLPDETATPTKPTTLISGTPTVTETPCFAPNSTQGQITCTPTATASFTPTVTPTVCFIYDNQGNFLPCTTPTPTVTPTDCYVQYPFAVVDCTPTPTWTPTVTPTICVSTVTPTPTNTGTPTGSETPTATSITAPNKPAAQVNTVPCTPTPTITPTATVCANGASLVAMVLCTPTPTATICFVAGNTAASVQCSPTPSPTLCVVPDATGTFTQCTPTPQTAAMMVYPEQDSNCRRGPDSNTQIDATLFQGQGYTPTGRTPDNLYLLFRINGVRCWAAAFLFDIPFGPLSGVPGTVLPYVNYPTATPTPTHVPATAAPSAPQCSDGVDNDGDGAVDYRPPSTSLKADPQCSSDTDNSE